MIKFTTLLISCSFALAGAAFAQQPDAEASPATTIPAQGEAQGAPGKKKSGGGANAQKSAAESQAPAAMQESAKAPAMKPQGAEGKAGRKAAKQAAKQDAASKSEVTPDPAAAAGSGASTKETPAQRDRKSRAASEPATAASAAPAATVAASVAPSIAPTTAPMTAASPSVAPTTSPATAASATAAPTVTTAATAAPLTAPAGQPNPKAAKKLEPQKLEQIKVQNATFRAQPRPDRVPAVTFQPNYRIQNSDRWQGPQYDVYRSYRPERHDRNWYHSRYQRVELIGGGYYYYNNNYWYPAWGYSPREEYYAYDAPIYVGKRSEPPDRIIADVQAVLQHMGYYKGEVDGLLGPLTRQALIGYQNDQGLTATAVMDQPTLDSLGLG